MTTNRPSGLLFQQLLLRASGAPDTYSGLEAVNTAIETVLRAHGLLPDGDYTPDQAPTLGSGVWATLPEAALEPAKAASGVITVDATRFLRLSDVASDVKEGTRRYLERVERERLAVRAPIQAPKGPPPGDLLTPREKAAGFAPLFDGRTLEGWTTLLPDWSVWSVENGAIKCAGKNGQWLRTRKRYGSFILRFEYKISRNGNSGVFVWSPLVGRSSRFGMEMQIRGLRKKKVDDDATGAIYDVLAPREDASNPPGAWNRVDIACRDSKVTVNINGRVVQDFDADEVPKLQGRLRRGVIGLQDHGDEVWFRNSRILELQREQ